MGDLAALLFTDVVDSTLVTQRLGDERARVLWAEHDRRARDLLRRERGREIDATDGFFVLFDDAAAALRFALAYQDDVRALGLAARVGLHVGPVSLRTTPADDVARGAKPLQVEGLAKALAARVMAMAAGGQVLATAAARQALPEGGVDGAQWENHGHYRLKGIDEPVEVHEAGRAGGSAFEPPHDTAKSYRVVQAGGAWRPLADVPNNLPAERDAFVGRRAELRELAHRFDDGARLVTLLGPGGTGKTRLVVRYAGTWLGDWPGGVYFCDLSEAMTLDGMLFVVARALGVRLGDADASARLGAAIAGRGRCLVVLDNFEQVVPHAAASVGRWLDDAAEAGFAVTSRERLHLPGEQVLPVEPLPLEGEAIELFALRARAVQPDFALDAPAQRAAVAEAVRLLDGLPLAIELAAARMNLLSPTQLVERMRDRFRLLAGVKGARRRQATLRAAIDWSWQLLAPWEQAALGQCSVFEGGFTLEAAEAVIDLDAWPEAPPVIDAVQALVDKSLLRRWLPAPAPRHAIDEPYFSMYISIHDYAAEKCRASGFDAEAAAQRRHGAWYAGCGSDAAIDALASHGGTRRMLSLQLELDNLIAACRRAVARGDGAVASATFRAAWEVLALQGPFGLGVTLGNEVCAMPGLEGAAREVALLSRVEALMRTGTTAGYEEGLREALARVRAAGDRLLEGRILGRLGNVCLWEGRLDEAGVHYGAALATFRCNGHRLMQARMLGNLAIVAAEQGRGAEARGHYAEALALERAVGSRRDEAISLSNFADLLGEQGATDEAYATFGQALEILRELGDRDTEAVAMQGLGELQLGDGRAAAAATTLRAGLMLARELGNRRVEAYQLRGLGYALVELGLHDEARDAFSQALAVHSLAPNRRAEGFSIVGLAEILLREGRLDEARLRLDEGERLVREEPDGPMLGRTLATRGLLEVAAGDIEAARAAIAELEALAAQFGVRPASDLARRIGRLRAAIGAG